MPIYEYYCAKCGSRFEELRPISRADEPAVCAKGHRRAARMLSVFAMASNSGDGASLPASGGGCCGGGGCGCGA